MAREEVESLSTSVYYYEHSPRANSFRLLYCIPRSELERRVKAKSLKKSILTDYPAGVDMRVETQEFNEFRSRYGLSLPFEAFHIWHAFDAVRLQVKGGMQPTGYLKRSFLDRLARDIVRALSKAPVWPSLDMEARGAEKLRELGEYDARMTEFLKSFPIRGLKTGARIEDQPFSRIKMSGTVPVTRVFSRLQAKTTRGG
jgi:hypothetical protein